jgi:predicted amidohydrolase YtcJ
MTHSRPDLLLYNAYVYPVSSDPIEHGAVVIRDGKIILVGSSDEILKDWDLHVEEKNRLSWIFFNAGFHRGHGHFSSLGKNLMNLDLLNTKNWEEIVDSVKMRVQKQSPENGSLVAAGTRKNGTLLSIQMSMVILTMISSMLFHQTILLSFIMRVAIH